MIYVGSEQESMAEIKDREGGKAYIHLPAQAATMLNTVTAETMDHYFSCASKLMMPTKAI